MPYPDGAKLDLPGGPHEPPMSRERWLQLEHEAATTRLSDMLAQAEARLAEIEADTSMAGICNADLIASVLQSALAATATVKLTDIVQGARQ